MQVFPTVVEQESSAKNWTAEIMVLIIIDLCVHGSCGCACMSKHLDGSPAYMYVGLGWHECLQSCKHFS